jgi:hypothetical protein
MGASTVRRMNRERSPVPPVPPEAKGKPGRIVTARYPGHVYHADLTVVPTALGFWTSWFPFSLPHAGPFAGWVGGGCWIISPAGAWAWPCSGSRRHPFTSEFSLAVLF